MQTSFLKSIVLYQLHDASTPNVPNIFADS